VLDNGTVGNCGGADEIGSLGRLCAGTPAAISGDNAASNIPAQYDLASAAFGCAHGFLPSLYAAL